MRTLLVRPHAGLCNRLRVLLSSVIYARVVGMRVRLLWVPGDGCWCRFSDLFEDHPAFDSLPISQPRLPARLHKELDWLARQLPRAWHVAWLAHRHRLQATVGSLVREDVEAADFVIDRQLADGLGSLVVLRNVMEFRPEGMTAEDYAAERAGLLSSLVPVAAVRERLFQLPPHTLGVHIRRGDHQRSAAISGDEYFEQAIEAHLQDVADGRIFLATDSNDVERRLRQRFGDRVLHVAKTAYARHDPQAIQSALVDLLMLSRCEAIVGSALSSFSEIAAAFHRVPLRIAGQR